MIFRAIYTAILAWTAYGNAQQQFLGSYDDGLFIPLEELSTLSDITYTTLVHPAFPHHSVRVKKSTDFCDNTVNSYTGYIDVEARHLFFYFFESRSNPDNDDVIFWTNGGPGGSSSIGLFMELGPCRVTETNETKFHPESWNSNANVFFIDQPIGVGFSYAEYEETVSTTEEAAKDVAAFVAIFFEHFTKFRGRAFHMAGESYGGRYIPLFASAIYDQNARLVEVGITPVNLTSIMIGNGLTDFYTMMAGYHQVACTAASVSPPPVGIGACTRMKQTLPRCQKMLKESCIDMFDMISCGAASQFCETELMSPVIQTGKNPYDLSKRCEGTYEDTTCYSLIDHITAYLDRPEVRALLGVDIQAINGSFPMVSMEVNLAFAMNMDRYKPSYHYVSALLDRGVRVLIYAGKNDWICNHVGNEAWTRALEWSGHDAFVDQPLRPWKVDGKQAGMTRTAKGLTYATIEGAGHMAPYDKPKESLEMVNRWLCGEPL